MGDVLRYIGDFVPFRVEYFVGLISMKIIFIFLSVVAFGKATAQIKPDFKPFIRSTAVANAYDARVKILMDSIACRFLTIANDSKTLLHKDIQNEFIEAEDKDRQRAYLYPKLLRRNNITVQFVNWTNVGGIYGSDSTWSNEEFTAMILIPLMLEEQKGNSVNSLCFLTGLTLSTLKPIDAHTENLKISFKVKKLNDIVFSDSMTLYESE